MSATDQTPTTSPRIDRVVGKGGLPFVILRSADGAVAEVCLEGAHVTSWRPARDGQERLFLSERSEFRAGVAIRGGIPVIFPQFAMEGPLPRHGFARTSGWTQVPAVGPAHASAAVAAFELRDSPATHDIWPASFRVTLTVGVVGDEISVTLGVENTGTQQFDFAAALHTYLRVHSVRDSALEGLQGARYRESSAPDVLKDDDEPVVCTTGELDRVYVDAPPRLALHEPHRDLEIGTTGFPDVVVWNPGAGKAAAMKDMEPGGAEHMLCVEAAAVQRRVALDIGRNWQGSQTLVALSRD